MADFAFKGREKEYAREYHALNREKFVEYQKKWIAKDPARARALALARMKKWRARNPEVARQREKDWRSKNKALDAAKSARKRASQKRATPAWADHEKIKKIYLNCPVGYQVDHVVPLKGRKVSGLHCEANLQYLPAIENRRKHVKFTEGE